MSENFENRKELIENDQASESVIIEELEFKIIDSVAHIIGSLQISSSGNIRKWRESRDLRGAEKYSNWSVTVSVIDQNNTPVVCDWIKISNCNYRIKSSTTVTEKASIGFTTDTGHGWDNIQYDVEVKCNGIIYGLVHVNLG